MKWIDWKKEEGNCKHCKMFYIDEVPRNFEDPKLGLQALEFPVICKHCSRTRFYVVRKLQCVYKKVSEAEGSGIIK